MKTIVVDWVEDMNFGKGKVMRVIVSEHPRFRVNSRFDYGYMGIAVEEGYTVVLLPVPKT